MNDRRGSPRGTFSRRLIATQTLLSNGNVLRGALIDISQTGARITGDTGDIAVGDSVTVTVTFPKVQALQYTCRVAHVSPGEHFGVQFL